MVNLPIPEVPDSVYRIQLDGRICQIRMNWNTRANCWQLSIEDSKAGRVDSVRVIGNAPLLKSFRGQIELTGDIVAVCTQDPPSDPLYDSFVLGNHILQYMTKSELVDWRKLNGLG